MTTATTKIDKTSKCISTVRAADGRCYRISVYAVCESMARAEACVHNELDLVAILLDGEKIVTNLHDAQVLEAAGIQFAYICEALAPNGKKFIVSIPVN